MEASSCSVQDRLERVLSLNWDGMAGSLKGGLHFGLSGFSFWSHDVPGFHSLPNFMNSPLHDDIYVRWTQFGVFTSHMRYHYVSPDLGGACPSEPIIVPVTEQLVKVEGSLERPVHDVYFSGIRFEYTSWTTPNREGWVTLQAGFPIIDAYKLQEPGLPHKASLENQAWIGRPQSAITLQGVERVFFNACDFAHLGACAVDYVETASNCHIFNCRFSDIGATAILVGDFSTGGHETHAPFLPADRRRLCHDIFITFNEIQHVGMEDWGAPAINAGFVYNTTIVHNEVTHCKWSGICLGWGWMPAPKDWASRRRWPMKNNHIDRNHVSHFGLQLHDCGAIYTLSYQPNSSIVGNQLDNMGRAPFATNNRCHRC